jgi:hypothetical protein
MLRTVPDERQFDGGESGVVLVQLPLRRQTHIDGAELDLLRLFGRSAEHVVGKDDDLDRAVGAALDTLDELLGSNIGGMIFRREMSEAHGQRGCM